VDRHRPAFLAEGVELVEDLRPAMVFGDQDRLLQVAGNLLDNALKYTPAGGRVTVTVDLAGADAPRSGGALSGPAGAAARLTVTDDGPGIDRADLPFVFDRFYRGQDSRGTAGAGLGLAICRALVEAQGGTIAAEDAPGGGARFVVHLPAAGGAH
jgi:signal transduction histidine kinase